MVKYALIGAPAEALGHPSVCSEPASGTVEGDSTVTYNGTAIANADTATIEFDSHGHSTDADGNCTSYSTHSITPETVSETVTYNGKGFFLTQDGVDSDPGTGGSVNITASGSNDTITE
jgi:uncharacterized Zn-binding protein involved in type VI secretion